MSTQSEGVDSAETSNLVTAEEIRETEGDEAIDRLFTGFREELDTENELKDKIREIVRELEQKGRDIQMILQKIHRPAGLKKISEVCSKTRQEFEPVQELYDQLARCISPTEYFRFVDQFRYTNQRFTYMAALLVFLETGGMVTKEEAAEMLGVSPNRSEKFYLDLEDYLLGLLQVAPELSRLAVNSVTIGDYERPLKIAGFLNDLDAGFRLLNLKNDALRKRFDGLKYEVKKVEEVVYDITLRGLIQKSD